MDERAGYGVEALLIALSYSDMQVTAYIQDEDQYLTATRIPGIPENLTYIYGECEEES